MKTPFPIPSNLKAASFLSVAVLVLATTAFAQSPIIAKRIDGRLIFMENDAPLVVPGSSVNTSAAPRKLVYWSATEHRWKAVPPPSRTAMRNARNAAVEVSTLVARTPLLPSQEDTDTRRLSSAPDTRAMTSGHRITQAEVDAAIETAAKRHNVDVNLVRSIIKVESNFNPRAVSRKGALGLMQLMPATARELHVRNPFDVNQNVEGGVRHFKGLLDNFGGDVKLSLAAYNAGAGAVERNNGVPPYRETRNYVKRITDIYGVEQHPVVKDTTIKVSRDRNGHLVFTND